MDVGEEGSGVEGRSEKDCDGLFWRPEVRIRLFSDQFVSSRVSRVALRLNGNSDRVVERRDVDESLVSHEMSSRRACLRGSCRNGTRLVSRNDIHLDSTTQLRPHELEVTWSSCDQPIER